MVDRHAKKSRPCTEELCLSSPPKFQKNHTSLGTTKFHDQTRFYYIIIIVGWCGDMSKYLLIVKLMVNSSFGSHILFYELGFPELKTTLLLTYWYLSYIQKTSIFHAATWIEVELSTSLAFLKELFE